MPRRTSIYIFIIAVCLGTPLIFEWLTTPSPVSRRIHIEAFRYGTSPSIIRANRGDQLFLTFSTRDTAHSFFLQDYRIDAKISPASKLVELRDPLRATDPPVDVPEVRLRAGSPGLWGSLVSVSRFRCHVYCGPMHGFEQGDLVVRPNWLFAGGLGILLSIVIIGYLRIRWLEPSLQPSISTAVDLNGRYFMLNRLLKWRPLQFFCTIPVLTIFTVVVLAGLIGTKVGARNIAVMMTWAAWMSMLTMVLVPLGGRLWCMVCPLPSLGEYIQRRATVQVRTAEAGRYGNRFYGLGLRWPLKLRGTWLRLLLFLSLGTLSASLAGQPRWTAVTLLILASVSIIMSVVWELRAFCRYVCPVGAFISCYSALGRLMVRKRNTAVCRKCKEKSCLRGNANGWACPYGLSVAGIERNADCGLCTECFKSCTYDNVSLAWRRGAWSERFHTYGEAWQGIVLLVLALVYSLTVHSPWPAFRDMVNVVDKATWPEFGLYAAALWALALGVFPLIFWAATGLGLRIIGQRGADIHKDDSDHPSGVRHSFKSIMGVAFKRTMPSLLPLGLSLWASFFFATFMVNFTFILLSLSDPFGWGWNLFGTAGMPWVQLWPSGIPWVQSALILFGLAFSLKKGYEAWWGLTKNKKTALRGFGPTALIFILLAGGMLIYFTNY